MPFAIDQAQYSALMDGQTDVYTLLAAETTAPACERTFYDVYGRVDHVMDYKQQVTEYVYDAQGRLEYQYYYEADGDVDGDNDNYVAENHAEYEYTTHDALGRQVEVYRDTELLQKFHYDSEGRVRIMESPQGIVEYEYNPVTGPKTAVKTYDTGTDPDDIINDTAAPNNTTAYAYDDLGCLDDVNGDTTYTYDAVGSRQTLTYGNGNVAEYVYNSLNRLTALTNWQTSAQLPHPMQSRVLTCMRK